MSHPTSEMRVTLSCARTDGSLTPVSLDALARDVQILNGSLFVTTLDGVYHTYTASRWRDLTITPIEAEG